MAAEKPFLSPASVSVDVQRLPKANLHTHLEGSVRPATLIELAAEQGLPLPGSPREIARAMQVTGDEQSLADYLAKIAFAYPVLKDARALVRTGREAAEDAARCNVRYFELRAGPVTHSTPELSVRAVIESILEGLAEAQAQLGITCRLIVVAIRHHPPEVNVALARTALEYRGAGVVGFDLAGDEARFPASLHQEAIDLARRGGLGITIHAGEAGGPGEVRYAVERLGATRIGHGVHSVADPSVVDLLAARQTTLEMCPTSNVHTASVPSIQAHPIRKLMQRGVAVTIGDDDPVTSRTNLSSELELLRQEFAFTLDELRAMQIRGIESSFLDDPARRAQLLTEFKA